MKPEEKAKELIDRFYVELVASAGVPQYREEPAYSRSKQCALICVDEILKNIEFTRYELEGYYDEDREYWQQVKTEIEKL